MFQRTIVDDIKINPKTIVFKKNIIIKNLIQNADRFRKNKYFNIWKYKELPVEEIEEIIMESKKKIIKRNISYLFIL